jgi:hypothetical protein
MDNMEKFIEFIDDLTTELYYENLRVDGKYIYTHGAGLTFIKIIENYFNIDNVYIRNDNNHCAFSYKNILYDATGIIKNPTDFKIANDEDILYMRDMFGGHLKDRYIYDTVINEMNKIENIPYLDNEKIKKYENRFLSYPNI